MLFSLRQIVRKGSPQMLAPFKVSMDLLHME